MFRSIKRPKPDRPGQGQESVWDYPRPPRVERTSERVVVRFAGRTVADSTGCHRVLETSHPPVYYVPPEDIDMSLLRESAGAASMCEFKGGATYFDVVADGREASRAAFTYRSPTRGSEAIAGCIAFYGEPMDEVLVDGEAATPQPGGFYAGWITSKVVGPFKGGPGTMGW